MELVADRVTPLPVMIPEVDNMFTCYLQSTSCSDVEAIPGNARGITIIPRLNDVRYLNKYFKAVNAKLPVEGYFIGCMETSEILKRRMVGGGSIIGWILYLYSFVVHRVFPKFATLWYIGCSRGI